MRGGTGNQCRVARKEGDVKLRDGVCCQEYSADAPNTFRSMAMYPATARESCYISLHRPTGNVRPPVASGRDVLSLPKGGALRCLGKVHETTCNV